jgi:hypothetical protein
MHVNGFIVINAEYVSILPFDSFELLRRDEAPVYQHVKVRIPPQLVHVPEPVIPRKAAIVSMRLEQRNDVRAKGPQGPLRLITVAKAGWNGENEVTYVRHPAYFIPPSSEPALVHGRPLSPAYRAPFRTAK